MQPHLSNRTLGLGLALALAPSGAHADELAPLAVPSEAPAVPSAAPAVPSASTLVSELAPAVSNTPAPPAPASEAA